MGSRERGIAMTDIKKLTQSEIVERVVRNATEPVPSWNLQKVNTPWGWLGTSGDRAARKLAEHGILNREMHGKYVFYSCGPKQLSFLGGKL